MQRDDAKNVTPPERWQAGWKNGLGKGSGVEEGAEGEKKERFRGCVESA